VITAQPSSALRPCVFETFSSPVRSWLFNPLRDWSGQPSTPLPVSVVVCVFSLQPLPFSFHLVTGGLARTPRLGTLRPRDWSPFPLSLPQRAFSGCPLFVILIQTDPTSPSSLIPFPGWYLYPPPLFSSAFRTDYPSPPRTPPISTRDISCSATPYCLLPSENPSTTSLLTSPRCARILVTSCHDRSFLYGPVFAIPHL